MVYGSYMTANTTAHQRVTVHRRGRVYAIVAEPGWTASDWDAGVPKEIQGLYPDDWNYRVVEGAEVWTINLDYVEAP